MILLRFLIICMFTMFKFNSSDNLTYTIAGYLLCVFVQCSCLSMYTEGWKQKGPKWTSNKEQIGLFLIHPSVCWRVILWYLTPLLPQLTNLSVWLNLYRYKIYDVMSFSVCNIYCCNKDKWTNLVHLFIDN